MWSWWVLLICDMLIPVMMLLFGRIMYKSAPKNINYIFGYRTSRSTKNQDTWQFAHKHCGSLWWKIGLIMLIPTVLVHIPFYNSSENTIGMLATIIMIVQVAVLIFSIIPTEIALKKTFNDDGSRKVSNINVNYSELKLHLQDDEWTFEYTDHDRPTARAIVFDDEGYFYFVQAVRDDVFCKGAVIETAGGGVEPQEDLVTAVKRECLEELGANVEVLCKIGVVEDYYNLIHRHNINNYYLCKAVSFGDKSLTQQEKESFHLTTLKLTYQEALAQYNKCSATRLGRLIANREIPILKRAKEILEKGKIQK